MVSKFIQKGANSSDCLLCGKYLEFKDETEDSHVLSIDMEGHEDVDWEVCPECFLEMTDLKTLFFQLNKHLTEVVMNSSCTKRVADAVLEHINQGQSEVEDQGRH